MFKVFRFTGISKIKFFIFSGTERVKLFLMRDTGGLGDMRNIGGSKATATPKMKLVVAIVIDD